MQLFKSPLIVLDYETTGFNTDAWARPIELGAVLIDVDGNEAERFETLIRPDILDERAVGALRVNHIDPATLDDAPDMPTARGMFEEWADLCRDPLVNLPLYVTSYNVVFDSEFARRMGLDSLTWASCVMVRAAKIMGPLGLLRDGNPNYPRFRPEFPWLFPPLAQVADHFGVPVVGTAHRALTDARVAAGIAVAIRRAETLKES